MNYELKVMKRIFLIIISLAPLLWIGCKEEGRIDHIDDSVPAPMQVTVKGVRSTPGGAVIKYTLPQDKNLLGIRAEYEIRPGVVRESKASYYTDSIVLEGFGEARAYEVKLFSVGKNGKESEPLPVEVEPTTAPVHLASQQLQGTFGGVSITIDNPERANLAVVLMGDTTGLGYQTTLQTFYTSAPKRVFIYRGLKTDPYDFSVFLRDRWGNLSNVVEATVTPFFEQEIRKTTWQEYWLAGDCKGGHPTSIIWDEVADESNGYNQAFICNEVDCTFWPSPISPTTPHWITWDLGVTATLSRLKFWTFYGHEYVENMVRKFELWGTTNPDSDGSWDSWTPLGSFEIVVPEGEHHILWARAGIEFNIVPDDFAPSPYVPVRYVRFKATEPWDRTAQRMYIMEISLWGRIE